MFPLSRSLLLQVASIAALALAWQGALALDEGHTEQGVHYLSGGVSLEERDALQAERGKHSLWVIVALAGSGAFTGDTQVSIRDAAGKTVFDGVLDGPWLFIDLPVGRYSIEARAGSVRQRGQTHIHAGDHHQVILRLPAAPSDRSTRRPNAIEAHRPLAARGTAASDPC